MKLRIHDNSLRLRLTQKEVLAFREAGRVECAVRFSAATLRYSLQASPDADTVAVSYDGNGIRVLLPDSIAHAWADGQDVGIAGIDSGVRILIEKDFQCLHKGDERDPDAFPNPLAS